MKLNNVTPEEWDEAFKKDNARKKREWERKLKRKTDKQAENKPKKPMPEGVDCE